MEEASDEHIQEDTFSVEEIENISALAEVLKRIRRGMVQESNVDILKLEEATVSHSTNTNNTEV